MAKTASKSRVLTDHEEIRRWAEERGATPARVRGTGGDGDPGMIRLDFPGYSGEESLEPIEWDAWFKKFDETNLALLVQDETATGERSNFNKLIGRETAEARAQGEKASRRSLRATSGGRATAAAGKKAAAKKTASISGARSRTATASGRASTRGKKTQTARGRSSSRKRAA
jgi:hypothetical protein